MMVIRSGVVIAVLLGACSERVEPLFDVDVIEDDSSMTIVAKSETREVGKITLVTGPFVMQDDGRPVVGRQLEVIVDGQTVRHESEGYKQLELPVLSSPEHEQHDVLLRDDRVRAALARRGIMFEPRVEPTAVEPVAAPPTEAAYHACTYAPTPQCGATSCIQNTMRFNNGVFCKPAAYQYICCGGPKIVAARKCGYGSFNSCGAEGPGGCAVCWTSSYTSSCGTQHITAQQFTCTDPEGIKINYNWDIGYTSN
jgi:hypothetical protein